MRGSRLRVGSRRSFDSLPVAFHCINNSIHFQLLSHDPQTHASIDRRNNMPGLLNGVHKVLGVNKPLKTHEKTAELDAVSWAWVCKRDHVA